MKKIICMVLSIMLIMLVLCGCGESYICKECEKTTTKAYYDIDAEKDRTLCESCAREYWMPLDYTKYRIK